MYQTITIKKASKLSYYIGYLVIYDGDSEKRIYISDISCLIIESTNTVLTIPLLNELISHNIAVIICNDKHIPHSTLLGINNNYQSSGNLFKQLEWTEEKKHSLWKYIVTEKIVVQNIVLKELKDINDSILNKYEREVDLNDITNREGLAAKVYFSQLFENGFTRSDGSFINSLLDYGYAIIASCFMREISAAGYNNQLGIWHAGKTNPYNLAYDFLEPFRPLIDIIVFNNRFHKEPLKQIRKVLTNKMIINNEERYIDDAIGVYTKQLIRYLNNETTDLPKITIKGLKEYGVDKSSEINSNV